MLVQSEVGQLQGQLQAEVKWLQGQLQQARAEEEEAQEQRHAAKLQLSKVISSQPLSACDLCYSHQNSQWALAFDASLLPSYSVKHPCGWYGALSTDATLHQDF